MNDEDIKAYKLAISGAQELMQNLGCKQIDSEDRAIVITKVEKILFRDKTIPLEFRKISDSYISNGQL